MSKSSSRWLSQQPPQQSKYAKRLILVLKKEVENQLKGREHTLPDVVHKLKKDLEAEWKIDYNINGESTMVKTTSTGAKVKVAFNLAQVIQGKMPDVDDDDKVHNHDHGRDEKLNQKVEEFFKTGRVEPEPKDLKNRKNGRYGKKKRSASDEDDSSSDEEKDETEKEEASEKKPTQYYDSKFRVIVSKGGKELVYTCSSQYGEIQFEDLELRRGAHLDNTSYSIMGQDQRQMYDYFAMEELGINQDLSSYINTFNASRERRFYIRFLNDVQEIVR